MGIESGQTPLTVSHRSLCADAHIDSAVELFASLMKDGKVHCSTPLSISFVEQFHARHFSNLSLWRRSLQARTFGARDAACRHTLWGVLRGASRVGGNGGVSHGDTSRARFIQHVGGLDTDYPRLAPTLAPQRRTAGVGP